MFMNKIFGLTLTILVLSCGQKNDTNPLESVDKDLTKVETASESELLIDGLELFLYDAPVMSNTFRIGEQMSINILNIRGLTAQNGLYDIGMSLKSVNSDGDTVVSVEDVFEFQNVKYPAKETVNIPFYINFLRPYVSNESYTIVLHVWDKIGGKSLKLQKLIKLLPAKTNGFIKQQGNIKLEDLIVYSNGKPYTGNTFVQGDVIDFTWILEQEFLDLNPAVITNMVVKSKQGEVVFADTESATLEQTHPFLSNKVYLNPENYTEGSYIFSQSFKRIEHDQLLILQFPFEVKKALPSSEEDRVE